MKTGLIVFRMAPLVVLICSFLARPAGGADGRPDDIRVLIVTGIDYPGHHWQETTPVLEEELDKDSRMQVEVLRDPYKLDVTDLSGFDVLLLHFMNWEKPDPNNEAKENLRGFVRGGGGLVIIHFACGAFQSWPEYMALAGRVYDRTNTHDPRGPFTVDVVNTNHPITRGMGASFETDDELYICLMGDKPVETLATARSKVTQRDHPMGLVHNYGGGRVFLTPLGHDVKALRAAGTAELIRRGTAWAAGRGSTPSDRSERLAPADPVMRAAQDQATGRWDITDEGRPVLSYNYQTNAPGDLLERIAPGNLKYARARSDYIHPLHGLNGAVLTLDWALDHPHHRGIYWAWPEVDYQGERGDLHALQRVFARPTGNCWGQSGSEFAQLEAENLWHWEDAEPIVREVTLIRAWRANAKGRFIDLEFRFTALENNVSIARRGTKLYGGLNIRLAPVADQKIRFHTEPAAAHPRASWAELSGLFAGGEGAVGLAVFQHPANPEYPGDWVQYPEINWFQPCFPAAGTRRVLEKNQTLTLKFRLWINSGETAGAELTELWSAYANPPRPATGN